VKVMQPVEERNNPAIADVLEACRVRLQRGETIAACLAAYPAYRAELASLLPLVVETQGLAYEPDPTYAAGARRRFRATLAAARENRSRELGARYRGPFGLLRRLAVPLVLVLVLSASGLGLVQASDEALPDNPLYTVKQAQENVGQVLARTPQENALLQLRLANRRFMEYQLAVKEKKGPALVEKVASNMVAASDLATERVLNSHGPNRAQMIAELRQLLAKEIAGLNVVVGNPRIAVSQMGQNLQWQLQTDEQHLAAAK
jgi:hypothetical protein